MSYSLKAQTLPDKSVIHAAKVFTLQMTEWVTRGKDKKKSSSKKNRINVQEQL